MLAVQTPVNFDDSAETFEPKSPVLTLVKSTGQSVGQHPLRQYASAHGHFTDASTCRFALGDFLKQHLQDRANAPQE